MSVDPRIPDLLARAEALARQAYRLVNPERPLVVRIWHTRRAWTMLRDAQYLLDEVTRLLEHPGTARPPDTLLGMGHAGWTRLQWGVGIANAVLALRALDAGAWSAAVFSLTSMLLCLLWVCPHPDIKKVYDRYPRTQP